jgi:hypothetical protein
MICDLFFHRHGGLDIRVVADSLGDSRHKLKQVQDVALDVPPRRLLLGFLVLLYNVVECYITY